MFVVHGIYGGTVVGDRQVAYHVQTSTDGVRWVDQGTTIEVDEASDTPRMDTHDVYGKYVRFQFGMAVSATPPGSVLFTLKVRLMRQS